MIVTTKGEVSEAARAYAAGKVARLHQHAHGPVLLTRVKLTHAEGQDVERNAIAEATLDVDGRLVRGQVAAHRIEEAVDLLVDRMIRQLDQAAAKARTRERRPSGDISTPTASGSPSFPRNVRSWPTSPSPSTGRRWRRRPSTWRSSTTTSSCSPTLTTAGTRSCTGIPTVRSTWPPSRRSETVDEALERLDAGGEPFVFFCAADTGRGAVAYLRYDGHYGLIRPADG